MALLLNPVSLLLSAKAPKAPLNDPLPLASPVVMDQRGPLQQLCFGCQSSLSSMAAVPTAVLSSLHHRG